MGETRGQIAVWSVRHDLPEHVAPADLDFSLELTDWVERNPSLIHDELLIIGRQIELNAGKLDLLGIDGRGRWVVGVCESGDVRRETIVRAIDCAAGVAQLPAVELAGLVNDCLTQNGGDIGSFLAEYELDGRIFDDRAILVYVIGSEGNENLKSMTGGLPFWGGLITVVNLKIAVNDTGEPVMLRKIARLNAVLPTSSSADKALTPEIRRLFKLADENGVGAEFRLIYDAANSHGLYPRTYKWSIMYTPPQHKGRCLICAWVKPRRGLFDIWIVPDAFAEFYPVSAREARHFLGRHGRAGFSLADASAFAKDLDRLFGVVEANW